MQDKKQDMTITLVKKLQDASLRLDVIFEQIGLHKNKLGERAAALCEYTNEITKVIESARSRGKSGKKEKILDNQEKAATEQ